MTPDEFRIAFVQWFREAPGTADEWLVIILIAAITVGSMIVIGWVVGSALGWWRK